MELCHACVITRTCAYCELIKTEYCAMSLLIRGARVVRNQVRGAVVSAPPSWPLGKRWALKPKRRKKVPPGEAALLRRSEFAVQPASLFRFDWSSVSTFWTCSHLGHSKVSRSETAGPCSIRASIMGAWHLGQRGRSIGISDGSAGYARGLVNPLDPRTQHLLEFQ